jgi:hypothetical protein
MEIIKEIERPEHATLKVESFAIDTVSFPSGDTARKLYLTGKIKELENQEIKMSNTTEGSLWVRDESDDSNIKVGSKSNTAMFFKIFKIKSEKDLLREYPLIQQPSKNDPTRKFYVIDTG